MSEQTSELDARIQLIEVPIASPGKCVICGKSNHDKGFINPRLDFEFYGTVYFCADCGGEIANVLGYISPEQAIMLAKRVKFLENELETHRDALLNLESAVEHLTDYRMLRSATSNGNTTASISGATDEASEVDDEASSRTVVKFPGGTSETESELNELASKQGSDDVSGTTSDDSTVSIIDL